MRKRSPLELEEFGIFCKAPPPPPSHPIPKTSTTVLRKNSTAGKTSAPPPPIGKKRATSVIVQKKKTTAVVSDITENNNQDEFVDMLDHIRMEERLRLRRERTLSAVDHTKAFQFTTTTITKKTKSPTPPPTPPPPSIHLFDDAILHEEEMERNEIIFESEIESLCSVEWIQRMVCTEESLCDAHSLHMLQKREVAILAIQIEQQQRAKVTAFRNRRTLAKNNTPPPPPQPASPLSSFTNQHNNSLSTPRRHSVKKVYNSPAPLAPPAASVTLQFISPTPTTPSEVRKGSSKSPSVGVRPFSPPRRNSNSNKQEEGPPPPPPPP
eukprot:PhF_6_TR43364/c1_g1_i2/m.66466